MYQHWICYTTCSVDQQQYTAVKCVQQAQVRWWKIQTHRRDISIMR
jgi:hypothetical protein